MNMKQRLALVVLGCSILAASSPAVADVNNGTSSTWDQFIETPYASYWGNWYNGYKRFATYAGGSFGTYRSVIRAVDSNGQNITRCYAEDTTPGNGYYSYTWGVRCADGVRYNYEGWHD